MKEKPRLSSLASSEIPQSRPRDWGRTAEGWRKWLAVLEHAARPVSETMLDMAEIGHGQRVLDLATGLGEPALAAARRVGPAGRVLATDKTRQMLDFARERAFSCGLDNIEFRLMEMEAIDLPESGFDAVLCRWGLMFVADLGAVLQAVRRVLRPGGAFAAAVWSVPERVPTSSLAGRIVMKTLGLPSPWEGAGTPFALSDIARLRGTFEEAGFREVRHVSVDVVYVFDSPEDYVRFRRDRSSLEQQIEHLPPSRRAEAWQAVVEALGPWKQKDGRIRMSNEAICIVGRR